MKHRIPTTLATLLLAALTAATALAQGPLAPPGAPAPTMKSLDQVEPRIPLVAGSPGVSVAETGRMTISQPGSYHLTGNVTITGEDNGIVIDSEGVTLDLMGYTVSHAGRANGLAGIWIRLGNATVQNGHICSGTFYDGATFVPDGFLTGVSSETNCLNVTVRSIAVQGVRSHGFLLQGRAMRIEGCSASEVAGSGILLPTTDDEGIIVNCVVSSAGNAGIVGRAVHGCHATSTVSHGIVGGVVENSYGSSAQSGFGGHGITASVVRNSYGKTSGGVGVNGMLVFNSLGESSSTHPDAHGISGITVENSYGHATHGCGIYALGGTISGSYGVSSARSGLYGDGVLGSKGRSLSSNAFAHGIHAERLVSQSIGVASGGSGIKADTANGSYGLAYSGAQHGIDATVVNQSRGMSYNAQNGINAVFVTHSYGSRSYDDAGRYGISATRAVGCYVTQGENITEKYDMP